MITHEIDFKMYIKIAMLLAVSSIGAVIAKIFQPLADFLFEESGFFFLLFIAIMVNMAVGVYKHWKARELDFKEFYLGTLQVVFVCGAGFALFMAIATLEGIHKTDIGEWFMLLGRVTVILYPAGSAFKNLHYITDGRFPPIGFMNRLKKFEKTGEIKQQ